MLMLENTEKFRDVTKNHLHPLNEHYNIYVYIFILLNMLFSVTA